VEADAPHLSARLVQHRCMGGVPPSRPVAGLGGDIRLSLLGRAVTVIMAVIIDPKMPLWQAAAETVLTKCLAVPFSLARKPMSTITLED